MIASIDIRHISAIVINVNRIAYGDGAIARWRPALTKKAARTRLLPDDRRAQLVRHAVGAFADHGIARATQAHVAARAGVAVSTVYAYFRTRADLVDAVLEDVERTIALMVEGALAARESPLDALTRLAQQTADMALHQPDTVRVWLDWSAGVRADVWPQFLLLQSRLHRLIEAVLLRHRDDGRGPADPITKSAARLFVGGAHTLALMRFENVSARDLGIFIDQMVGGVLAALARNE